MEFDELDDIYRDVILEHRRNPRNRHKLEDADITADGVNPFCGDEIHLQLSLDEQGRVARVGLQGQGCAINRAAGSMLTEVLTGFTLSEIEGVSDAFGRLMRGDRTSNGETQVPGDLSALSGVRKFPVRIKCALLAWFALDEGIEEYRGKNA